jgi:hypothetical protein
MFSPLESEVSVGRPMWAKHHSLAAVKEKQQGYRGPRPANETEDISNHTVPS